MGSYTYCFLTKKSNLNLISWIRFQIKAANIHTKQLLPAQDFNIFCNLEKAFDLVNYEEFLSKLEFYGIVGNVPALIISYLSDR